MLRLRTLFVLIVLLLCSSAALATTLKIATVAPEGSFWTSEMRKAAATIADRTSGRVKIKVYPGGVMGNEKSVLRKIRIGQLHGGMFTGGGLEDVSPNLRLYSLPLLFNSYDEAEHIRAKFDPKLTKRLADDGFISFGFAEGGFGMFMGNNPIHGVNDLRGKKVWVPEGDQVYYKAMKALGLSPVPLPITDVLTGLQTGLVDIVATSPMGALVFQWQTRIKYIATTPLTYLVGVFALNKKAFQKLSAEDQKIVHEVIEPLFANFDRQNRLDNQTAMKTLAEQGIVAIDQSKEEIRELRALTRGAIEELSQNGFFDRELWLQMEESLRNYRKQHSE